MSSSTRAPSGNAKRELRDQWRTFGLETWRDVIKLDRVFEKVDRISPVQLTVGWASPGGGRAAGGGRLRTTSRTMSGRLDSSSARFFSNSRADRRRRRVSFSGDSAHFGGSGPMAVRPSDGADEPRLTPPRGRARPDAGGATQELWSR